MMRRRKIWSLRSWISTISSGLAIKSKSWLGIEEDDDDEVEEEDEEENLIPQIMTFSLSPPDWLIESLLWKSLPSPECTYNDCTQNKRNQDPGLSIFQGEPIALQINAYCCLTVCALYLVWNAQGTIAVIFENIQV